MPYKRRSSRPRRNAKRRMYRRKRYPMYKRSIASNVHTFVRSCTLANLHSTGGALGDIHHTFSFALSDLPNFTEFTSLFDQYRIRWVELTFVSAVTQSDIASAGITGYSPQVVHGFFVNDYDDSLPPSSKDELMQYGNCRIIPLTGRNRPLRWKLYPHLQAAAAPGIVWKRNNWLDAAHDSVAHCGLKTIFTTNPLTNVLADQSPIMITVYAKYCIQCKNSR